MLLVHLSFRDAPYLDPPSHHASQITGTGPVVHFAGALAVPVFVKLLMFLHA